MHSSCIYLFALLPAFAQAPGEGRSATDQTKPPPAVAPLKQSVTVTATRGELATEEAPVSVSAVTSEELASRRIQILDQALNTTPGVYAYRGKGAQDTNAGVGMRGFAGRGSGQARTLILLDGQPLNDSYTGQVNWTGLPVEEVERVEVVRGSFSALYGGNAMGGVVNILTKPVTQRQVEFYGQLGNQASARYGGRVADRWKQRYGMSLAYDRFQTGGYPSQLVTSAGTAASGGTVVTGAIPTRTTAGAATFILGQPGNNWWNQHSLRWRGEAALSGRTTLNGQYQRQWSGYGYDQYESFLRTASGAVFDAGTASFAYNGAWRRFSVSPSLFVPGDGQSRSWLASGRLRHQFEDGGHLELAGGHANTPLNYYSTPGTGSTAAGGPGSISDRPYRSWFGSGLYARTVASRHHLMVGTDLRQDRGELTETSVANWARRLESPLVTGHAQGQALNEGVYGQDRWQVAERLSVTAGLRYDYWRTSDGGFGTGSAASTLASRSAQSVTAKTAALWRGPGQIGVRASVGNSFRSPSVYDLYRTWRSSSGITYAANPALEPERMLGYEAGANRRWGQRYEVDAAWFQNRVSNLIYRSTDFTADPAGNYRPVINAARGRTNGFEASGRLGLVSWLSFSGSYTWNDAKILENPAVPETVGKRVPFVPRHTAAASLTGAYRRFRGSLTGRNVSRVFSADLNTDTTKGVYGAYDPFFVLDAGFSLELNRHLSVEGSGENLLGRVYYNYYPSPGRLFSVRLRVRL